MFSRLRGIRRRLAQRRSTRLTAEGFQFLVCTLAVGVAAINTGNNLFYLLLAMMLSLVLVSGVVAERCLRGLEFHRHVPDLLFANQPIIATLVVKNCKSRFPTFAISIFDVMDQMDVDRGLSIRQLLPGTSQLLSYPLLATKRGRLQMEGVRIVTSFPFGFFLKKAYYPLPGCSAVCPEIRPLEEALVQNLFATGHDLHAHRRGQGNDLYNLRLYHPGDDSRNIHWTTTAKTSKLIVRETEAEHQQRATIYLATQAPRSDDLLFEDSVAFTASLVSHLSDQGYFLKLIVGSHHSDFGQGTTHLFELLQTLALCERQDPDYALPTRPHSIDQREHLDEEVLLVVRAWDRAEVPFEGHPIRLIDAAAFAKVAHVT